MFLLFWYLEKVRAFWLYFVSPFIYSVALVIKPIKFCCCIHFLLFWLIWLGFFNILTMGRRIPEMSCHWSIYCNQFSGWLILLIPRCNILEYLQLLLYQIQLCFVHDMFSTDWYFFIISIHFLSSISTSFDVCMYSVRYICTSLVHYLRYKISQLCIYSICVQFYYLSIRLELNINWQTN